MTVDLRKGDCLEIMKNIPYGSVDMILCDLPYGVTQCKWDSVIQLDPLWEQYKRITKNNAAIVLFGAGLFTAKLIMSNAKMFRYDLVWEKNQGTDYLNSNSKPMRRHENICVFYKHKPTYNKQYEVGKPYKSLHRKEKNSVLWGAHESIPTYSDGRRNPTSILRFNIERGLHPTQKPIALLEWLIKTYTNAGETVLDNCMGSESTGVACMNTGRNFIGIEIDEGYFAIAEKRIEEARLDCRRDEP